jgi:hypothetical protein
MMDTLRTRLQATVDHVAQQLNAHKLCLALVLADGLSFQLITCSTTRAAAALQLWLEHALLKADRCWCTG